jgi:uncharacterized protein (DUF736 family)
MVYLDEVVAASNNIPLGHSGSGLALRLDTAANVTGPAATPTALDPAIPKILWEDSGAHGLLTISTVDTPISVVWGSTSTDADAQPTHRWYLGKNVGNAWRVSDIDANDYLNVSTTTGSETVTIGKASTPTINVRVNGKFGFNATPVVAQTVGAVTNNITSGGTDGTLTNWTNLSTYATDADAIRNAVYQLGRSVVQITGALRAYGLGV